MIFHYFRSLFLIFICSTAVFADVDKPLKEIGALHSTEDENEKSKPLSVLRVKTARVVVADYELLRRDFPELNKFSASETAKIDEWILSHAGFIAQTQAAQQEVNTPILTQTSPPPKNVIRPFGYGRGLVFEVAQDQPLLDGKGFGAENPTQGSHSNGLGTTGEMLREFMMEKAVQHALLESGSLHCTLGSYAVIDWGFSVIHADGSDSPAGAILRQASTRTWVKNQSGNQIVNTFLPDSDAIKVERILRSYGITSCGDTWNSEMQRINIQASSGGAILDFGAFLIVPGFQKPAFRYTQEAALTMTPEFLWVNALLHPKDPNWVKPNPRNRIPFEKWGGTDPKKDLLWNIAHDWSEALSRGQIDMAEFRRRIGGELHQVKQIMNTPTGETPFALQPHPKPLSAAEILLQINPKKSAIFGKIIIS